jgi:hypothetical protein
MRDGVVMVEMGVLVVQVLEDQAVAVLLATDMIIIHPLTQEVVVVVLPFLQLVCPVLNLKSLVVAVAVVIVEQVRLIIQ